MTSSHFRFTGVLINIIRAIRTIHCSSMHTCIIFYIHFIAICEYPIILLYLFTFFYSWSVLLFFVFFFFVFAISLSRNAAFEKRLCMEWGPGLPKWSLPRASLSWCDLFNFFLWSLLVSAGNGGKRTGALEKGLLSVNWAFPTSDTL